MKATCWLILTLILEYRFTSSGKSQLCDIDSGRTNIIVDIRESRGNSTDQVTNPLELPINGEVNTEITLQLTRNGSVFGLNQKKLIVMQPVDRDETKLNHIVLQISCIVRSSNKKRAIPVIVRVSDINDNAPIFVNTPYEITISEATPVGTTIFKDIRAEDRDAGVNGLVEYFIIKGENYPLKNKAFSDDGFKTFEIAYPHQGQVTVAKTLDFEKIQRYHLTVVASDRARNPLERLSSTTTLIVNVADSDDLDPSFIYRGCTVHQGACVNPQYTANIFSGESPRILNVFPERIQAIDLDSLNTPIKYSFLRGKPDSYKDFIQIDEESGQLKQIKAVDETTGKEYEIIVKAEENSESKRFTTAKLIIAVKRYDENPPVLSASDIVGFVHENSAVGTAVTDAEGQPVRFRITDADLSDEDLKPNYTYELTSPYFAVSLENILIVNNSNLDRDPPNPDKFRFQIVARESSRNAASSPLSLTVHLIDVNDNSPKFVTAYPLIVLTGKDKQLVTRVEARDNDAGKNAFVKYSIYHVSNNGASLFDINDSTGQIETVSKIPSGGKYSLTIRATDAGGLYGQAVVEVIVNHETNTKPPMFAKSIYEVEVNEDVGINTTVMAVEASDPENDPIIYSIISGNDLRQFTIDRENGEISVIRNLDRESLTRYQLIVRAQDQGGLSSSCIVNIFVVDVNDESPQFNKPTYSFFAEEERKSFSVGSVHATDADEGINAKIKYMLPLDVPFKINSVTGEIKTNAKLDYETQNEYKFIVTAKDSSALSRSGTTIVIVTVTDVQDERPRFEETQIISRVPENVPHYTLSPVKAIDMDAVEQITYILRSGPGDLFKVDAKSGQIKTIHGLDYEKEKAYELYVGTSQNSKYGSEDFVKIKVIIGDRNDNAPIFLSSPDPIIINDKLEVGAVLRKVSAIDCDGTSPANKVRYGVIGRGKALQYFTVNESLGTIQMFHQLDDEMDTEFQIVLRAQDMGQPVLSSILTIPVFVRRLPIRKDFKEQAKILTFHQETPVLFGFKNSCYDVYVSEKTALNTTLKILEVISQGKASEEMAQNYECKVVVGNERDIFKLFADDKGCNLTLVNKFEIEVNRVYILEIKLLSHTFSIIPEKSVVTVNVFALKESYKSPEFVFKEFLVRKSKKGFFGVIDLENKVGTTILKVSAVDHVAGKLGGLKYTIYDGADSVPDIINAPSTYFSIGELTGVVRTRRKIQEGERFPLQFLVEVRHSNDETSSNRVNAKIIINLISNENRLSLGLYGVPLNEVEKHLREFENMLNMYAEKLIVIIERISYKNLKKSNTSIPQNDQSTIEMLFYAIDIKTNKILPTNSTSIFNYFLDLKSQIHIKRQASRIMKSKGEMSGIYSFLDSRYQNKEVLLNEENNIEVFKYVAIIISMVILALGTAGIVYVWISGSRLEYFYKERRSFPSSHNMSIYFPVENGIQQVRESRNRNDFETHVSTFAVPVHAIDTSSNPGSLKKRGTRHLMQNNVKESVSDDATVEERDVLGASDRTNVKNVVRQRTLRKIYSTDINNQFNVTELRIKNAHPNTLTLGRLKHSSSDYANVSSRSEKVNNQLQQLQDNSFSYTLGSRSFFKKNYLISGTKNAALEARDSEKINVYTISEAYNSGASNDKIVLARYGLPPLTFPNLSDFDRSETETTTEL